MALQQFSAYCQENKTVVTAKITNALSAWWGLTAAVDYQRLQFARRVNSVM